MYYPVLDRGGRAYVGTLAQLQNTPVRFRIDTEPFLTVEACEQYVGLYNIRRMTGRFINLNVEVGPQRSAGNE